MGLIGFFGGAIGWMVSGSPLGALLGYVLGSLFDSSVAEQEGDAASNYSYDTYSADDNTYQQAQRTTRDNFIFSLLVLTAAVIKADGKIMHSEMEYVRRYFRLQFGDAAAQQANDILLTLFKQDIDIEGCGRQMADHMDYSTRLQLLDFLVGIAKADGRVTPDEVQMMKRIARAMLTDEREVDSLLGLGQDDIASAYQVLEVSPDVSDADLKRAYKKLVLKHHPDRVAALGDDIRLKAEEKLKLINDAYNKICRVRGL